MCTRRAGVVRGTFLAVTAIVVLTGCGSTSTLDGAEDAGVATGSGAFTVFSDRPIAGSDKAATYRLSASFVPGTTCNTTTVGACTLNPCYTAAAGGAPPLPTVGSVAFAGAQIAPLTLEATSNGSYATLSVQGAVGWRAGGESVTVTWAHGPDAPSEPGGSMTVASPPYVALVPGSALTQSPATLSRQHDLDLSWTSDTPPSSADLVLVDVMLESTQITCSFDVAAGSGVVPASMLQQLGAGTGTYDLHSKEYAETSAGPDGSTWPLSLNVDAHLRAGSGLAVGAVVIE